MNKKLCCLLLACLLLLASCREEKNETQTPPEEEPVIVQGGKRRALALPDTSFPEIQWPKIESLPASLLDLEGLEPSAEPALIFWDASLSRPAVNYTAIGGGPTLVLLDNGQALYFEGEIIHSRFTDDGKSFVFLVVGNELAQMYSLDMSSNELSCIFETGNMDSAVWQHGVYKYMSDTLKGIERSEFAVFDGEDMYFCSFSMGRAEKIKGFKAMPEHRDGPDHRVVSYMVDGEEKRYGQSAGTTALSPNGRWLLYASGGGLYSYSFKTGSRYHGSLGKEFDLGGISDDGNLIHYCVGKESIDFDLDVFFINCRKPELSTKKLVHVVAEFVQNRDGSKLAFISGDSFYIYTINEGLKAIPKPDMSGCEDSWVRDFELDACFIQNHSGGWPPKGPSTQHTELDDFKAFFIYPFERNSEDNNFYQEIGGRRCFVGNRGPVDYCNYNGYVYDSSGKLFLQDRGSTLLAAEFGESSHSIKVVAKGLGGKERVWWRACKHIEGVFAFDVLDGINYFRWLPLSGTELADYPLPKGEVEDYYCLPEGLVIIIKDEDDIEETYIFKPGNGIELYTLPAAFNTEIINYNGEKYMAYYDEADKNKRLIYIDKISLE